MSLSSVLENFNRTMYESARYGLFYVVDKLNESCIYCALEQHDGTVLLLCKLIEFTKKVTLDEFNTNYIFSYSKELI